MLRLEQPGRVGVSLIPIALGGALVVAPFTVIPGQVDSTLCVIVGLPVLLLGLLMLLFRDTLEIREDGSWRRVRGLASNRKTSFGGPADIKDVYWRVRQGPDPDSRRPRNHYSIVVEFREGVEFIVTPHPKLGRELGLTDYPPLDEVVAAIKSRLK